MIYEALERIGLASFDQVKDGLGRLEAVLADGMPRPHAEIMTDLTALSAAEIRVAAGSIGGQPLLPLVPQPRTLRLAMAKTDTLPTWPCRTPERIANGRAHLSDCFVFEGDLDKVQSILGTDNLDAFRERFVEFVTRYVAMMKTTPVGRLLDLPADVYMTSALIWRARLDVLGGRRDFRQTETTLRKVAGELGFRHLLA